MYFYLVIDDSQYEIVKEKPTKSEVVYANVKSSLKPLTPLSTIISDNDIRSKDVTVELTYEVIERSLLDNTKKKSTKPQPPLPYFNPKIPRTLPITINDLGDHVTTCHLNDNKNFDEEYKVI